MGNELKVIVKQELGKISFNFEEIKQQAINMTKKYNSLVLTEDDVQPAKKDRAMLNHKFDDLDTKRKEIKKTYMEPLNEFETKVKEIGKIISDASDEIDKQIKIFDDAEKKKKKEKIQAAYDELIGEMGEYLPLTKIYDTKWENVSVSMKSIKEDIETVVSSTQMAVTTIKDMNSEVESEVLGQYRKDLSLVNAISYINKHEKMKAEILAKEEQKRKAEEDRKRIIEENRIKEQDKQRVIEEERKRVAEEKRIQDEKEQVREEERLKAAAKIQEIEQAKAKPVYEVSQTWGPSLGSGGPAFKFEDEPQFEADDEPFTEEPFTDESFDVENELPFVTVGEVKATFTVVGTLEELDQVAMILNSVGLFYERKDA